MSGTYRIFNEHVSTDMVGLDFFFKFLILRKIQNIASFILSSGFLLTFLANSFCQKKLPQHRPLNLFRIKLLPRNI